jgi:hypothetical protein
VAEIAENCLVLINQKFSRKENIEITLELGQLFINSGEGKYTRETIEDILKKSFPDYTEEEVEYILNNLSY